MIEFNLMDVRAIASFTAFLESAPIPDFVIRYNFPYRSPADNEELQQRTLPVLTATGFFKKTKFKSLQVNPLMKFPLETRDGVSLWTSSGVLIASRDIQPADCVYMSSAEFIDFLTGIAAEGILAACSKYKLDFKEAEALAARYPVNKIPFSTIGIKSSSSIIDPPPEFLSAPLTDEELAFDNRGYFQHSIGPPFSTEKLATIGSDTISVQVPYDLRSDDDYSKIANAMFNAPKAYINTGAIAGIAEAQSILECFRHVRRLCFRSPHPPEILQSLSRDLLLLTWDTAGASNLDELTQFEKLEHLSLRGKPKQLTRLPVLPSLRALDIWDLQIKNLNMLTNFDKLQSLGFCRSKITDVSALRKIGRLQYLHFSMLPGLESIDAVGDLHHLEYLSLYSLNKIDKLPSMKNLTKLRRLFIYNLRTLNDLSPIAEAPYLEEVMLFKMKHLTYEQLLVLKKCKKLRVLELDTRKMEKALGFSRDGMDEVFRFSHFTSVVSGQTTAPPPSSQPAPNNESTDDDDKLEELQIHIKVKGQFGADDLEKCHDIADRLEEIIQADLLGRWDGEESGGGYRTIFFVGPNAQSIFKAVEESLKLLLPKGSHVEIKNEDGHIERHDY